MKKSALRFCPLTDDQKTLAQEIQKRWIDPSQYDDCSMAIHLSHALAQVIDLISKNALPIPDVENALEVLRYGYFALFGDQMTEILLQLLGGSRELVDRIRNHENARSIVNRIFKRIGPISPGMDISTVEISDILEEEGFSA